MGLPEKYAEEYTPKPPIEDVTFLEKIGHRVEVLKDSFSTLSTLEKIALIALAMLIVGILAYVIVSVFSLLSLRRGGIKTYQGTKQSLTAIQQPQSNSQGQLPNSGQSSGTIKATGIGGIVQTIVSNITNSTSSSKNTMTSTTGTSGQTNTTPQSSSSKSQGGTSSQPYIVNFLYGLLYFENPQTGQVSPYIVTNVNPSSYIWETYVNDTDGFSISYPKNWTIIKRTDYGHEGVAIFPPSEDPENKDAKIIGFGWSAYHLVPRTVSTHIYYQTSITIDNVFGQLYTLGGEQGDKKGIAVLLPHRYGYVTVGGSTETDELIYVLQYMLGTLKLKKN